jgi:hypothetical protein
MRMSKNLKITLRISKNPVFYFGLIQSYDNSQHFSNVFFLVFNNQISNSQNISIKLPKHTN